MRALFALVLLASSTGCAHYGGPRVTPHAACPPAANPGELNACWTLPTLNTDDSTIPSTCTTAPCGMLTHTRIQYGSCSGEPPAFADSIGEVNVDVPAQAATIELPAGTYCTRGYAVNDFGNEAAVSDVAAYQVTQAAPVETTPRPIDMIASGGSEPPPSGSGTAELTWTAPTANTDGTALVDLNHYLVYWAESNSAEAFQNAQSASVPGTALSYTVTGLAGNAEGKAWWFGIQAINAAGGASAMSNLVSKTIVGARRR